MYHFFFASTSQILKRNKKGQPKTVASFLVVELMRQGKSPQDACQEAIKRIVEKAGDRYTAFQVGLIAVNKQGEIGAYCIHKWFNYTVYADEKNINYPSDFYIKT